MLVQRSRQIFTSPEQTFSERLDGVFGKFSEKKKKKKKDSHRVVSPRRLRISNTGESRLLGRACQCQVSTISVAKRPATRGLSRRLHSLLEEDDSVVSFGFFFCFFFLFGAKVRRPNGPLGSAPPTPSSQKKQKQTKKSKKLKEKSEDGDEGPGAISSSTGTSARAASACSAPS